VRPLNKKLVRDIVRMRWQVVTIALVVAAGVANYVSISGTYASLLSARDSYYERERFGDVFARCERAPRSAAADLAAIPGVARVYPRVVGRGLMPMPSMPEPAGVTFLSLPADGVPPLVGIVIVEGRAPDPDRTDEALILEAFAQNHGVSPGDEVSVVMNGTLREVRVVGVAMSPEYILAAELGGTPGDDRFAVLWMPELVLAAAFDLEGAFSDVVIATEPGANERAILAEVDRILEPFGGVGAVPRSLQTSAYVVDGELAQLRGMATTVPFIFLSVAAFLLHVALSRLVELQRGQIAILRAVGYQAWQVGAHYLALVAIIGVAGGALGVGLGGWLGDAWMGLYLEFFRFPREAFRLTPEVAITAIGVSLGAALVGALSSVRRVMRLPPAEAMRPASPDVYRASILSRLGIVALFETGGRMVLREIERRPGRLLLSSFGIAMSVAILVAGRFNGDAIEYLMVQLFERAMREDVTVTFVEPVPAASLSELSHLPGAHRVEGYRQVPVRMRVGHVHRDVVLAGHPPELELRRIVDQRGTFHRAPDDGMLITSKLAEILGVTRGEEVSVEVLTGQRRAGAIRVVGLVDEMYGLQGYMTDRALGRFLDEEPSIDVALVTLDPRELGEVRRRIARYPGVGAVVRRAAIVQSFREQTGRMLGTMTAILTLFAAVIAIGVVYNNARVALSMRERDLATLRVLGLTRREVGSVLFGEIAAQLVLGIPLGLWAGYWMARGIMSTVDPERYRWPVLISPATYAFAVLVVLVTTMATWGVFRERLRRLDLIAVLKTRE
jgi:putative ABC transport system permease protein